MYTVRYPHQCFQQQLWFSPSDHVSVTQVLYKQSLTSPQKKKLRAVMSEWFRQPKNSTSMANLPVWECHIQRRSRPNVVSTGKSQNFYTSWLSFYIGKKADHFQTPCTWWQKIMKENDIYFFWGSVLCECEHLAANNTNAVNDMYYISRMNVSMWQRGHEWALCVCQGRSHGEWAGNKWVFTPVSY